MLGVALKTMNSAFRNLQKNHVLEKQYKKHGKIFLQKRNVGPYYKYSYGGKDFQNKERLQNIGIKPALGMKELSRCRGSIHSWDRRKGQGMIRDDLTGDLYLFTHKDIVGKIGIREILMLRNVEFTPTRQSMFKYNAKDVIDLGPSNYKLIKGVTEQIKYPRTHLFNKPQWSAIPYWYHPIQKSYAPLTWMPKPKPTMYKDGKLHGPKF